MEKILKDDEKNYRC